MRSCDVHCRWKAPSLRLETCKNHGTKDVVRANAPIRYSRKSGHSHDLDLNLPSNSLLASPSPRARSCCLLLHASPKLPTGHDGIAPRPEPDRRYSPLYRFFFASQATPDPSPDRISCFVSAGARDDVVIVRCGRGAEAAGVRVGGAAAGAAHVGGRPRHEALLRVPRPGQARRPGCRAPFHLVARTGVVATLGTCRPPIVALCADMDAMPIQVRTHAIPTVHENIDMIIKAADNILSQFDLAHRVRPLLLCQSRC